MHVQGKAMKKDLFFALIAYFFLLIASFIVSITLGFGRAESSRELKGILLFPDGLVDFDFLQGVAPFSAAFCAEVPLIFHGGTLPSSFTFFFIIVSLPLIFVNNKAADSLPLAESTSGFIIF